MEPFDIEKYIEEKILAKQAESPGKDLHYYKRDMKDVKTHYQDEVKSLKGKLSAALEKGEKILVIEEKGSWAGDRLSKWGFVAKKAMENFLYHLTEKGHTYTVETKTYQKEGCGEIDTLSDTKIFISLTYLEKLL